MPPDHKITYGGFHQVLLVSDVALNESPHKQLPQILGWALIGTNQINVKSRVTWKQPNEGFAHNFYTSSQILACALIDTNQVKSNPKSHGGSPRRLCNNFYDDLRESQRYKVYSL